ncbi:hypothetical protein H8E88_08365, partial [candidate division KSB1 bacterium]|nr:hypothetical protein [candidate division KSB1 bacterium]
MNIRKLLKRKWILYSLTFLISATFSLLVIINQNQVFAHETASIISPEDAISIAINKLETTTGGLQLNNPNHTVTFTSDAVCFKPTRFNLEWKWQLLDVYAGTKQLLNIGKNKVKPSIKDEERKIVSYDRGGIIEQYISKTASIEQQFIIPELLRLEGDLVIKGQVNCAGILENRSENDGWQWRTEDGAVVLGDVTVFDDTGTQLPAYMNVSESVISIEVDGAALATAIYPVTIDPEVGTNDFRISDMGPDGNTDYIAQAPDVAYNSTDNEYLVVWSGGDNTGSLVAYEFEIYGQRINAVNGVEVGGNDFRISDMGPDGDDDFDGTKPAVAYNSTNGEYLVVWCGRDVVNEDEIYGQRLNAATCAEIGTNDFRISDMGPDGNHAYDAINPDVAYNSANNEYLVVWAGDDSDEEWEVYGQRINAVTGAEIGTNDFRISDMGPDGNKDYNVGNSKVGVTYNSADNEYLVVWCG